MANAKKLSSGNWRIRIFLGTDKSGHKCYKSFTAPTKKQAEREATQWQLAHEKDKDDNNKQKELTVEEAMDSFLDTCRSQGYSPSTICAYLSIRNKSFPELLPLEVSEVTAHQIQQIINAHMMSKKIKTVRNEYYFLKKVMFIYAPDLDLRRIIIARKPKPKKRTFDESLPDHVLVLAREDVDFYLYCNFVLSASLRPSETFALTWGDISKEPITIECDGSLTQYGRISITKASVYSENREYVLKDTKTAAGNRVNYVDWSFFEDLYSLKPRGKDDEQILSLKPNQIGYRWNKLKKRANLPENFVFYDLRHYFATDLAYSGASEEEIRETMGHSSITVTHDHYIEMFKKNKIRSNEKMAQKIRERMSHFMDTGKKNI